MTQSKVSILLFCDDQLGTANTVLDHIHAFLQLSRYKVYKYNPKELPFHYFLDLNEFDVVVIHYSLPIVTDYFISADLRRKIHDFKGLKIQYIQDDYRQVDQYVAMMRYLGIHVLFTPYPLEKIPLVYDEKRLPGVTKRTTLTGYVPERHREVDAPALENRPIDVGYRGREIPYWLGILGQEKAWVGEGFLKHVAHYGLKCDISCKESDRIYGKRWDQFISSCKAMLGTESGVSITDFDGSVEAQTRAYLTLHPHADFWEIYEKILKSYEGNLMENTISPRAFECAAHRTAMVLFPGEYSKVLQPWVHYIPLQKDFSNIDEVVTKLRDIDFLKALTERAYNDLIGSGRYAYLAMIKEFDEIVENHLSVSIAASRPKKRFWLAQRERRLVRLFKPWFDSTWRVLLPPLKRVARLLLPTFAIEKIREFHNHIISMHRFQ